MMWAASSRHPTDNLWLYYARNSAGNQQVNGWTTVFQNIWWFNSAEEAQRVQHYYMVVYPVTEDEVIERCVQQEMTGEPHRTF